MISAINLNDLFKKMNSVMWNEDDIFSDSPIKKESKFHKIPKNEPYMSHFNKNPHKLSMVDDNIIKRESLKSEIERCKKYQNELNMKIETLKAEDKSLKERIKTLENEYSAIKINLFDEIKQKYISKVGKNNLMYFEDFEEIYNEMRKNKNLIVKIIDSSKEKEIKEMPKYTLIVEGGGLDDETLVQIKLMKRMFNKIIEIIN